MIKFEYPVINGRNGKKNINLLFPDSEKPLKVEIGFGNGIFIQNRAQIEQDVNFVGIELYHKGIRALAERIKKNNLKNLIIIYGDAKRLLADIRDNQLDELYINFPDPWPKKRHKKRRLINIDSVRLAHAKLKKSSKVYLATDSEDYAQDMLVSFEGIQGYKNLAGQMKFAKKEDQHIATKYEKRYQLIGKKIYYLQYQVQK